VQVWPGATLMVSRAGAAFAADGALVDGKVREQLAGFLAGFAAFASRPAD
jgi:hypothetical protein